MSTYNQLTWKHQDLNRLCPKISPITGSNFPILMISCVTSVGVFRSLLLLYSRVAFGLCKIKEATPPPPPFAKSLQWCSSVGIVNGLQPYLHQLTHYLTSVQCGHTISYTAHYFWESANKSDPTQIAIYTFQSELKAIRTIPQSTLIIIDMVIDMFVCCNR